MLKAAAVFTFAAVLILSGVTGALATSIVSDTSWTWIPCTNITTCGGAPTAAVAVTTTTIIPPWHNPTTGTWISSLASGFSSITGGTVQQFSKTIDFGVGGSLLTLKVWADDTAAVLIDGVALSLLNGGSAPNLVADTACAAGTLGCEDTEFGQFSASLTGSHELQVRVLQLDGFSGTPFGTLVEGDLAAVPEPATILLLGSALATAGVVSRRRFRKSAS